MIARRSLAVASATVAALVAVLAASAWAAMTVSTKQSETRPRGVVEDCSTRSEATFPHAFTSPRNLVVGPLALVGAAGTPRFVWSSNGKDGFQKFPLLVRSGHRVTVELSARTRKGAGLAYGPLPQGETHLADTHRVVTFSACKRGERARTMTQMPPYTFWSGGLLARTPRCIRLQVWVDEEHSPRRAVVRLGVQRCG
jgi:hypothetical protein